MAAARSLLFQLPRFVSSRLAGPLYHRASASPNAGPGLQRILAADASHKEVAVHSKGGDAIVATSLPREADVAAELLAGKDKHKPRPPGKPKENPDKDKHHGVPDKKAMEGKQGTRNNYAASSSLQVEA